MMNDPKVLFLIFKSDGETLADFQIQIKGHPTEALQEARDVASSLIAPLNKAWSIKKILFDKVGELNSDWTCHVEAGLN